MEATEAKEAAAIEKHDIIANLGIVDAIERVGVFLVFQVRGTVWSLACGRGDVQKRDFVFHETEPLFVISP